MSAGVDGARVSGAMQDDAPLLEVDRLLFGPSEQPLAEPLSFRLDPGRCLVLLGPNGAGKTSLLRTLIGGLAPLGGSVRWLGRPPAAMSPRQSAATIAFAAPRLADIDDFSVEHLLLLGRLGARGPFAQPDDADRRIVDQVLERCGLRALRERRLGTLSDGERQLATLGRALAQQARVLLLDEPAASLDPGRQATLLDTVAQLVGEGQAVILSSHDPNHALAVADQVLLWQPDGHILWGDACDLLDAGRLSAAYGVAVRRFVDGDGKACFGFGAARAR